MKENITIFLKGFIIGIGKIIPGVSGSLLAISLGIYEKCIDIISNLKDELKYNIGFLFYLCIGILFAILIGSRIIYFFISNHYFLTMCLFIGLICGTFPNILKRMKFDNKKELLYIIVPFIVVLLLGQVNDSQQVIISHNFNGYIYTILIGFIDSVTMIVPGISGTAIFMMLGVYDFVLFLFSNIFTVYIVFFLIGLFLGIILVCKLMNYYFKNYNTQIYLIIIGFSISSILILLKSTFSNPFTVLEFLIGLVLIICGFLISLLLNEK